MDIKAKLSKLSIKLKNLTENVTCGICQGYIIDATTISECLHSFCKSCIVHFIKTIDHKCPTCNLALKDVATCIKSDSSLQRLIYQLIPNLLENELDRREKFMLNDSLNNKAEILNNKSLLNVKLYFESKINNNRFVKEKYIQCVAQTPVSILIKLIRSKYNIPNNYRIRLSYKGHKLTENETLLQLFTSFILTQNDVFEIRYELLKNEIKEKPVKIECVTDLNENVKAFSKLNIKPIDSKKTGAEPSKPVDASLTDTNTLSTSLTTNTPTIQTVEVVSSAKSPKVFQKNFLKVKFRNRLGQSSGMSYPSFNLVSMKRYQPNKKIRPLKKKLTSKESKPESEQQASNQDEINCKKDEPKETQSNEIGTVENEKEANKNKTETENSNPVEAGENIVNSTTSAINLEAINLGENALEVKEENSKAKSESEDEDKLFINEDSNNNVNSDAINEKAHEIANNEASEKASLNDLQATSTENKAKEVSEKIENNCNLDSTSVNLVELPLDLTINKK